MKPVNVRCTRCGKLWTLVVPASELRCGKCGNLQPVDNAKPTPPPPKQGDLFA